MFTAIFHLQVKVILGDLEPTEGEVTRDRGARVALVNQHHAEQLDYDMTPLAFMLNRFPGDGSYNDFDIVLDYYF